MVPFLPDVQKKWYGKGLSSKSNYSLGRGTVWILPDPCKLIIGTDSASTSIQGAEEMSFPSVEDGENFTRWVGEKFYRFVEFLGVSVQGKEDRVLELPKDIGPT